MKKQSSYENLQKHIRAMKTPGIEVWENQYPDKRFEIHIEIPEFTCICPKTGLPDFAVILIDYIPSRSCVELKSLKEYLFFYRNVGIFHEHFANKLMDDFIKACGPRWVKMVTKFNPRGGITTVVTREYRKK
ncbi:MAG: preQ(1) synthase [Candidatus Omnitrophota bacterium]